METVDSTNAEARRRAKAGEPGPLWIWSARQSQGRGRAVFFRGDCARCHTIRGTEARGDLGPDLTHVGSRRSLAAGVLANHVGTMGGWIAGTQALKPGSQMPDSREFDGAELRALSAWLKSLE